MGFFSFFSDCCDWAKEKFEDVKDFVEEKIQDGVDWLKEKLSRKKYDPDDVEDHVDVDAVLAYFREKIQDNVDETEKICMDSISVLFSDLIEKTKEKFPDLVEIIKSEQQKAETELRGTIMKYVKEHLSKNDTKFLEVLKMNPGKKKEEALDLAMKNVLDDAEKSFSTKLKKYVEHILEEFSDRLDIRIKDQKKQMDARIMELEKLQKEAERGDTDLDRLKNEAAPIMEASECIIEILNGECD